MDMQAKIAVSQIKYYKKSGARLYIPPRGHREPRLPLQGRRHSEDRDRQTRGHPVQARVVGNGGLEPDEACLRDVTCGHSGANPGERPSPQVTFFRDCFFLYVLFLFLSVLILQPDSRIEVWVYK
jgi:hypothetical protein